MAAAAQRQGGGGGGHAQSRAVEGEGNESGLGWIGHAGWTKGLGRTRGARSDVAPSWTAALASTGDKVVKL